jgi:hypothetical protein
MWKTGRYENFRPETPAIDGTGKKFRGKVNSKAMWLAKYKAEP